MTERMGKQLWTTAGALLAFAFGVVSCAAAAPGGSPAPSTPNARAEPGATNSPVSSNSSASSEHSVEGTVVHFTAGSTVVKAVLDRDTPTARSFVGMLPMTLRFSDFGGNEKVASPPRPFDFTGAEGMKPEAGDLFSYRPWSNLGFFYKADGSSHSDSLVRIGRSDEIEQIVKLDGQDVTISIAK
jgi:hypothetical protein